jgi:hypothetical protein
MDTKTVRLTGWNRRGEWINNSFESVKLAKAEIKDLAFGCIDSAEGRYVFQPVIPRWQNVAVLEAVARGDVLPPEFYRGLFDDAAQLYLQLLP